MPRWLPTDRIRTLGAAKVLFEIVKYVDASNRAWPSVERIARGAGISRATTFRALAELEEVGIIERMKVKSPSGQRPNVYMLTQVACGETQVAGSHVVRPSESHPVRPRGVSSDEIQTEQVTEKVNRSAGGHNRSRARNAPELDDIGSHVSAAISSWNGRSHK